MSSSFVILFRNFLYDKSTSCLQSENKVCKSIFLGLTKFLFFKVFKVPLKDFFFRVARVGLIWNNKKLT